jgi:Alpha/beta-hydrolase family
MRRRVDDGGRRGTAQRAAQRGLLLAVLGAFLSRRRSIVPRTPQDDTLISAGVGLVGGLVGVLAELAIAALARMLPGGRRGATSLLGVAGVAGLAWRRNERPKRGTAAAVDTAGQVLLGATVGGELALEAYERLPGQQRTSLAGKAWTTALAAASAAAATRRHLAEPTDLVKASVRYRYLPSVSGGNGSALAVDRLDREGRKFLGCALPGARISEVMGGDALDPIRVYAGLDSSPSPAERGRLAVAELDRLGAFERSRIVVFCPTGAGYVNPVAVEAEELLSGGDVASVVVQYSDKRALRAFKQLDAARETWRSLMEQLGDALEQLPAARRPEIVVYGESLGAWVVAEAIVEGGAATIGALHIARGALLGVPYPARVKLRALRDSGEPLPDGIGIFAGMEELAALPEEAQRRLRYVLVTHAEDPVGVFSGFRLAWERPDWLTRAGRHPRIPAKMRWLPWITYVHLLFDIKNSTARTEHFDAYAHDYRAELPALLRVAFGHLDVSAELLEEVEAEVARSARRQAEREQRGKVVRW